MSAASRPPAALRKTASIEWEKEAASGAGSKPVEEAIMLDRCEKSHGGSGRNLMLLNCEGESQSSPKMHTEPVALNVSLADKWVRDRNHLAGSIHAIMHHYCLLVVPRKPRYLAQVGGPRQVENHLTAESIEGLVQPDQTVRLHRMQIEYLVRHVTWPFHNCHQPSLFLSLSCSKHRNLARCRR